MGPKSSVIGEATTLTNRMGVFHITLTPVGALSRCVKKGLVRWLMAYGPQRRYQIACSGSQQWPIHELGGAPKVSWVSASVPPK